MSERLTNLIVFACVVAAVVASAQALGIWINSNLAEGQTWEINSLIHFTHIRNHGGVFGLAQGMGWLFTLLSLALLAGVTAYLILGPAIQRLEYICFGFIVGGGLSNILDRLIHGSVIDYIDIQHIPYWNYVFNTADVMVHIGIWPLLLYSLFGQQHSQA